jgi:transposase
VVHRTTLLRQSSQSPLRAGLESASRAARGLNRSGLRIWSNDDGIRDGDDLVNGQISARGVVADSLRAARLIDADRPHKLHALGIDPETCALDRGYDNNAVYGTCSERNVAPMIPLRKTPDVVRGEDKAPCCEHGEWQFAGADYSRNATKWRCPTGECKPASVWIRADRLHPLIPRETLRWKALYRRRVSVERQFGRLKNDWALAPLRVRGIERVQLHADLTILAKLSCALARASTVALAA